MPCTEDPLTQHTVAWVTDTHIAIEGDLQNSDFYLGVPFNFKYTFSKPYPRRDGSRGESLLVGGGNLQIIEWTIEYDRTKKFDVVVEYEGYSTDFTYSFDLASLSEAIENNQEEDSGHFIVPVMGKNDEISLSIQSSDPYPTYFVGAGYVANYHPRNRNNI